MQESTNSIWSAEGMATKCFVKEQYIIWERRGYETVRNEPAHLQQSCFHCTVDPVIYDP